MQKKLSKKQLRVKDIEHDTIMKLIHVQIIKFTIFKHQ